MTVVETNGWVPPATGERELERALRDAMQPLPDTVEGCRCRVRSVGAWTILELEGELDMVGSDAARKVLFAIPPARDLRLALDLRGLCFMDSTGIRFVLQALQRADEHGAQFALIRGGYAIQHVLELVGLADQLRFVDHPAQLDSDA